MTTTERQFFQIYTSGDGDLYVCGPLSEKTLLDDIDNEDKDKFLSEIPNTDPMYWGCKYLIIEGKIVTPKPKEVIMEYAI